MAPPKTYGVLIFDELFSVDMMGPLAYLNNIPGVEIFFISDTLSPTCSSQAPRTPSPSPSPPSPSRAGLLYLPTYTLDTAPLLDVLLIPGGGARRLRTEKKWEQFIARVYRDPTLQYLLAVCTGVASLARSGVLDGKRATTNKESFSWVASQGPGVEWVKVGRWIVDGNIWTSSGATAGTDMACAFVGAVYGEAVANEISKLIEHIPNTDPAFDPFAAYYDLPPPPTKFTLTDHMHPTSEPLITQFGVLAFPGFVGFDAFSVLAFVESLVEFTDDQIPLNVSLITPSSTLEPVWTAGHTINDSFGRGQAYLPTHTTINPPANLQVLIVPGLPTAAAAEGASFPHRDELVAFVKTVYPSLRHIISVGTGSALLAAAGILNGRSATTSKALNSESVTKSVGDGSITWTTGRWVRDGNIWTASGAAAGLDAAHALFAEMYGEALARRAAEVLEYLPLPRMQAEDDPFAALA